MGSGQPKAERALGSWREHSDTERLSDVGRFGIVVLFEVERTLSHSLFTRW